MGQLNPWTTVCGVVRLKELEQQYALEKAATERQFEIQRQVRVYCHLPSVL